VQKQARQVRTYMRDKLARRVTMLRDAVVGHAMEGHALEGKVNMGIGSQVN
jgi:hypothetical protein